MLDPFLSMIQSGLEKIMDPGPDQVCPESLDPNPHPVNIRPDPKPAFLHNLFVTRRNWRIKIENWEKRQSFSHKKRVSPVLTPYARPLVSDHISENRRQNFIFERNIVETSPIDLTMLPNV